MTRAQGRTPEGTVARLQAELRALSDRVAALEAMHAVACALRERPALYAVQGRATFDDPAILH